MLPAQPNQSIIDGLNVLQELAIQPEPVSGKALSQELGLETTKVNRILKTFEHLGLAYKTNSRKYTGGPGMHVLAAQSLFASGLIQAAFHVLAELHQYKKVVALGVLWRDMVSYLYHWHPGISATEAIGRNALFPADKSSIGIALLAAKPAAEVNTIYAKKEPAGNTRNDLFEKLTLTRQRGYGEAQNQGSRSLALTIGQPPFAGIALSGDIPQPSTSGYLDILEKSANTIEKNIKKS